MARKPPIRASKPEHNGVSPTREDGVALIEVHVAGVCVRHTNGTWQALVAKRIASRHLFPNKWECGGGMVRPGEDFRGAIRRQISEELGLEVEPVKVLEDYAILIHGEQRVIPGVRYLCLIREGQEPRLSSKEFCEYRWVKLPTRSRLDWIGGIKEALDLTAKILEQSPPPAPKRKPVGFYPPQPNLLKKKA